MENAKQFFKTQIMKPKSMTLGRYQLQTVQQRMTWDINYLELGNFIIMKEIGLSTPREILNKFALIIQKPKPNEMMVQTVINGLPIDSEEKNHLQLHGCGDWSRNRSSEGSIVLSNTNYVLKIPLGDNNKQEPLAQAKIKKSVAEKFTKVSPPTSFFIAQVDGSNSPPR